MGERHYVGGGDRRNHPGYQQAPEFGFHLCGRLQRLLFVW